MKKFIAVLVLLSFALPILARAEMVTDYDSLEKDIIMQLQHEQEMKRDAIKPPVQVDQENPLAMKTAQKTGSKPESGSSWWKWALAVAVVGGLAAAAGGGGGGGGGDSSTPASSSSGGTGSFTGSW